MTTSTPAEALHGMEFVYSLNRLNVATSRAHCASFLVANPTLFEPECRTPRQMRMANAFCRYRELQAVRRQAPFQHRPHPDNLLTGVGGRRYARSKRTRPLQRVGRGRFIGWPRERCEDGNGLAVPGHSATISGSYSLTRYYILGKM